MKATNKERNLFEDIDLQIMLCNERIKNHRRSIEKAKKMCGWYGPSSVGGINYEKDASPTVHIAFADGLTMIRKDEERIRAITEERKELRRSKKKVKKIYESLSGYESQVYYNRVIMRKTQEAAAESMSLSTRQLQRIEAGMKDKGLM